MKKIELARQIFLMQLSIMKKLLDLMEFKFGKTSDEFKYLREKIFDHTYEGLIKIFKTLETNYTIKKCANNCNLRKGFKDCECGGSGYINCE